MENDLKQLVGNNEKILYEGKPSKKCFVFESIFNPLMPFALIWAIIDFGFIGGAFVFGEMKEMNPADETVQKQVKRLQDYITAHFYNCTPQILYGLGQMYAAGGEFTENIDKTGGAGTAEFASKAIAIYCGK